LVADTEEIKRRVSRREFLRQGHKVALAAAAIAGTGALLPAAISPAYGADQANEVVGPGTTGKMAKWVGSLAIGNSILSDSGTSILPGADGTNDMGSPSARFGSLHSRWLRPTTFVYHTEGAGDHTMGSNPAYEVTILTVPSSDTDSGIFNFLTTIAFTGRNQDTSAQDYFFRIIETSTGVSQSFSTALSLDVSKHGTIALQALFPLQGGVNRTFTIRKELGGVFVREGVSISALVTRA
jgi:hypothetical protein